MTKTDKQMFQELPERYYLAWEQDVLEGLNSMEQMTKEIFATGRADIMDETVRKYHEWEELLNRYRGYLADRSNYCRVLDNGFHLYEPRELLKVIERREYRKVEHSNTIFAVQLSNEAPVPNPISDDEGSGNVKFSKYGFATEIEQIEKYVDSIADYENTMDIPQDERLVSPNNVLMVRQMNDGANGQHQLLRPVKNTQEAIHAQEQTAYEDGFTYVWEIILLKP